MTNSMHLHVISFTERPFTAWGTSDMHLRFHYVMVVYVCQGTSFRTCSIFLVCTFIVKNEEKKPPHVVSFTILKK